MAWERRVSAIWNTVSRRFTTKFPDIHRIRALVHSGGGIRMGLIAKSVVSKQIL